MVSPFPISKLVTTIPNFSDWSEACFKYQPPFLDQSERNGISTREIRWRGIISEIFRNSAVTVTASVTQFRPEKFTNMKKVLSAPFHFGAFYLVILNLSDRNFVIEADGSQIPDHNNKLPSPIVVIRDV